MLKFLNKKTIFILFFVIGLISLFGFTSQRENLRNQKMTLLPKSVTDDLSPTAASFSCIGYYDLYKKSISKKVLLQPKPEDPVYYEGIIENFVFAVDIITISEGKGISMMIFDQDTKRYVTNYSAMKFIKGEPPHPDSYMADLHFLDVLKDGSDLDLYLACALK